MNTTISITAPSHANTMVERQITALSPLLRRVGIGVLRYGLAIVLVWIGAMKFTAYEAAGIAPLVTHSPLFNWAYQFLGERVFSSVLGVVEIALGFGLAARFVSPRVSGLASLLSVGMFLSTLTFLVTTPGWEPSLGGFPALSALPGQFLLKDLVLLGAALFTAGEAFSAVPPGEHAPDIRHD